MIVKIMPPGKSFSGVKYNTNKIDRQKGKLMKVANFGPLQAFGHLKPQDYINYLNAVAALNKNVKLPQFHAVISGKGKAYTEVSLTAIAESWLNEMGYGKQPYLIVFHHDTDNNHIHMVSARVDKNGQKIRSDFEFKRAQQSLGKVLGYDTAMQYRFGTRAQFFMIMESLGYPGTDPDEKKVAGRIASYNVDKKRAAELRGLLLNYRNSPGFCVHLKERHGIDLMFHGPQGKKPYGYSIIDHHEKIVFKGSEVLPLKELLISAGDNIGDTADNEPAKEKTEVITAGIRSVQIADDVDDQQIHGMRRRRQKKARTNTR